MLRYTKVYGISHVDVGDVRVPGVMPRLWARFILIDEKPSDEKRKEVFGSNRQIRGFANGGLPIFTIWIHPDAEISFTSLKGGAVRMIGNDGETFNLDAGVEIRATWPAVKDQSPGGEIVMRACAESMRNPKVTVEQIEVEMCPHGPEVDEDILKSYEAPNYCVTAYVPKGQALELSRNLVAMTMGLELNRRLKGLNLAAEESLARERKAAEDAKSRRR